MKWMKVAAGCALLGMVTALTVRSADEAEVAEAVTNAIAAAFPDCGMTAHPGKSPYWGWDCELGTNTTMIAFNWDEGGESIQESGSMTGVVSVMIAGYPEECRTNWSLGDGACSVEGPGADSLMWVWYSNVLLTGTGPDFAFVTNLVRVAVEAVESVH